MSISKDIESKLDYYEQVYFSLDEPIPFKGELKLYPVKVKDYYIFHTCLGCLTMDKTVKYVQGEMGEIQKVPDIKGMQQTYLAYLIDKMSDPAEGVEFTVRLLQLFELIFQINRGMYCPECGKEISYEEFFKGKDEFIEQEIQDFRLALDKELDEKSPDLSPEDKKEIIDTLMDKFNPQLQSEATKKFIINQSKCTECGATLREIISIKEKNGIKTLMVKNVEINSNDFELFKALVPRQNILDYDDDKYIDPELKEELEIKAKLQNKDYTAPTLEKQIVCVAIGTGFTLDYLKNIPMRKLSLLLRLIDRKETYYAQLQGQMSGLVSFKGAGPQHWIFSDDKKNIAKELTSLDDFTKKFAQVT